MAGAGAGGPPVEVEVVVGAPLAVGVGGPPLMEWEEQVQQEMPGQSLPSVLGAPSGSWENTEA